MRYLLSNAIGSDRLPQFKEVNALFGQAHYSWKINANLYRRGLNEIRELKDIEAPDIYQDPIAKRVAGIDATDVHLADKPIESLRPLFGNKNVAIEVWEFPELSTQDYKGDPRNNQVAMLRKFDAVWCGSSFTAENMQANNINAIHLPPPVSHFVGNSHEGLEDVIAIRLNTENYSNPVVEDLDQIISSNQKIFLCVLAPFDRRKNFKNLIQGFLASEASKNSILLVKLVIDNIGTTVRNINEILRVHYGLDAVSDKVVFIGKYLTEGQMATLYSRCSFFVSAASAEGLNLPLIEAMTYGRPVIAPNNTAMRDYISPDHAIVMRFGAAQANEPIHSLHEYMKTTHFPPSARQVKTAFTQASRLSRARSEELGARGSEFVKNFFGLSEFSKRVEKFERDCL